VPPAPHSEKHFTGTEAVRDTVIGMSDGLTVPFALAAGLSGAVDSTGIIVTAGLAEIAAGSIAMGLGGYLAAKSAAEHYRAERAREEYEVKTREADEIEEVKVIFADFGVSRKEARPLVDALRRNPKIWVDFMMRFELGLEAPNPRRALLSALTIAFAYILGGFIPLGPYLLLPSTVQALYASVAITSLALLVFGYVKGRFTGTRPFRDAFQTLFTGGLAAGAAFLIARAIS
jgi:vacuolar iron transporter family protein